MKHNTSTWIAIIFAMSFVLACGGNSSGENSSDGNQVLNRIISLPAVAFSPSLIDNFSRPSTEYPDPVEAEANLTKFLANYTRTPCRITPDNTGSISAKEDPLIDYQWYLDAAKVKEAWSISNGSGVLVAINDSGVQLDHEDLAENMQTSINVFLPQDHPNKTRHYPAAMKLTMRFESPCNSHGTAVAGIIGAVANNSRGIAGIAYGSKMTATDLGNFDIGLTPSEVLIDTFTHNLSSVAVSSNSWNSGRIITRLYTHSSPIINQLLENGIVNGFHGKGVSYVWAVGNSANLTDPLDPSSLKFAHTFTMASYVSHFNHIASIPVCAAGVNRKRSIYSQQGGNLWLCGFSDFSIFPVAENIRLGSNLNLTKFANSYIVNPANISAEAASITSTDFSRDKGYNPRIYQLFGRSQFFFQNGSCDTLNFERRGNDFGSPSAYFNNTISPGCMEEMVNLSWPQAATASYTRNFGGTSAATPVVSGVIALMRSARPELGWRDVKLILAETATAPVDPNRVCKGGSNKRSRTNEVYCHDHNYGFGLVDAYAAVNLAKTWDPITAPLMKQETINISLPLNSSIGIEGNSNIDFIEYVQIKMRSAVSNFGELNIQLEGPSGQNSILSLSHDCIGIDDAGEEEITDNCPDLQEGYTFGSSAFLGGDVNGDWILRVTDRQGNKIPDRIDWKLIFYGHLGGASP